ncbi:MAG: BatA domain-containing protein [Planctomycetota bacterium]
MSFLSMAFLLATPLVTLPFILHFWDRRRDVEVPWGAMQFLQTAQTQQSHSRRLREWLQLLCRALALAALILALARPLIPGAWLGAKIRTETVVLLDNSMSTARLRHGSSRLGQLIELAKSTVQAQSPHDSVRFMTVSPKPNWLTPVPVQIDSDGVRDLCNKIDQVAPTQDGSDLLPGVLAAVQLDHDPMFQLRRIVVVTDAQETSWPQDDSPSWDHLQERILESKIDIEVEVIGWNDGDARTYNVSVARLEPTRSVIGVDGTVRFLATVENRSEKATTSIQADWWQAGELIESIDVPPIEPRAVHTLMWEHSFDRAGTYSVACKLKVDDELPQDNQAVTVVKAVQRIPILLVDGGEGFSDTDQDSYFAAAALGRLAPSDPSRWKSVFAPRVVRPSQLATMTLAEYQAIVVPNLQSLQDSAVEVVSEFVRQGGGLWIGLGPRTDVAWFNDRFFADGDGLSPVRLSYVVEDDDEEPATFINPYLAIHPATRQLVDQDRLDVGDVRVSSRMRFDQQSMKTDLSVLLGLTNGQTLAVEQDFGQGRVIVQAIPLRLQWSDLVQSHAFVVMMQDWLAYLTEPRSSRHNLRPGEHLDLRLRDTTQLTATLQKPNGNQIELTGQQDGDEIRFHTAQTAASGLYELELGLSGRKIPFAVDRSPAESNLATVSRQRQQQIINRFASQRHGLSNDRVPTATLPIWSALLIGLVGLMFLDLLLSGAITRQRFSVGAIQPSETGSPISSTPLPIQLGTARRVAEGMTPQDVSSNQERVAV